MFLLINNSDDNQLDVVMRQGEREIAESIKADSGAGLLENIDILFKKHHFKLGDLKGVAVVVGKGRFTLTRIAVTVANTLAYAMRIPVAAIVDSPKDWLNKLSSQPIGRYVSAQYSAEPNIGKQKKKLET